MIKTHSERVVITLIILSSIAINICGFGLPIYTYLVYDRFLMSTNIYSMAMISVVIIAVVCIEAVMRIVRGYIMHWFHDNYKHQDFMYAIKRMANLKPSAATSMKIGKKFDYIEAMSNRSRSSITNQWVSFVDVVFLFIALGIMAAISFRLMLVTSTVLTVYVILTYYYNNRITERFTTRDKSDELRTTSLMYFLRNLPLLKYLNCISYSLNAQHEIEKVSANNTYEVSLAVSRVIKLSELASHTMILLIILVGAPLIIQGQTTFGMLIACMLLAGRMVSPLKQAMMFFLKRHHSVIQAQKISEFLALEVNKQRKIPDAKQFNYIINIDKHVPATKTGTLRDVHFALAVGDAYCLQNIPFALQNEFVSLLIGEKAATHGKITLNQIDITTVAGMHTRLVYLDGMTLYTGGTIKENIQRVYPISDDEMLALTSEFNVHDEIIALSQGYDTVVRTTGKDALDENMLQTLACIRLLAHQPSMLIINNLQHNIHGSLRRALVKYFGRRRHELAVLVLDNDTELAAACDNFYVYQEPNFIEVASTQWNDYGTSPRKLTSTD